MTTLQTIQRLFTVDEIRAMFTSRKFDRIFVDCALGEHGKEQLSDNEIVWDGYERAINSIYYNK